jgi:hypothetical protein
MNHNTLCNCKICRNNLADIINDKFINDNISILDAKKYLAKNHNLDVTENVIKRHLKNYNIEINNDVEIINPTKIISPNYDNVVNKNGEILIDLNDINLDKYDFDKNDLMSIAAYIQKIHLGLYLKQCEIATKELEEYKIGIRENYPNTAINNLKKLFELMERSSGIRYSIDINAASDRIYKEGYKIISDGFDDNL